MARQTKSGIDYFPLDVSMDDNMKLIEAEFGLKGFAVVVKLWQKIYGGEGYYCEWTEEVALLFKSEVALGSDVVSEIVNASIRRGIFDKEKFDKYGILTSKGIQTRYFEATNRRKELKVKKQYLLISVDNKHLNADINSQNVNIKEENADINPQSKVKKSKVKKSKVDNISLDIPTELSESWISYLEMRKTIKKPMTDNAKKLAYAKLMNLSKGNLQVANAILQESVINSWQGLFPLKEVNQYGSSKPQGASGTSEYRYGETLG